MNALPEQIKNQIDENHQQFQPIIDELAKDEPECSYNYWDGWHKS